jgi:acyl-coenzyme A thioesterase PaaI-like protein
MLSRCDLIRGAAVALLTLATQGAWAQEMKMNLFKVVTVKDEIIIGLSAEELRSLGGNDASAVAHALAQKGDLTVWQYNVHRGQNGELQQAPTARIGLLANASLRVEPYTTSYQIMPHP